MQCNTHMGDLGTKSHQKSTEAICNCNGAVSARFAIHQDPELLHALRLTTAIVDRQSNTMYEHGISELS